MNVVAVATTKQKAGGTYTAHRIFDRIGVRIVPTDQPLFRMFAQLATDGARLHHIQFEYRTFGGVGRSLVILPLLTALLRLRGPVVVTLHGLTTAAALRDRKLRQLIRLAFQLSLRATGTFVSALVVHTEEMRRIAEAEYGIQDVVVIPLGSDPRPVAEGGRVPSPHVVFFGFIRPQKGVQHLVAAVQTLKDEIPDIRLTVAGSVVREEEGQYLQELRTQVRKDGLDQHVRFMSKFLSEEEISALMQGASVLALPYTDQYVEASAVVHDLAGFGVPLICSDIPRFSELVDGTDCLKVPPNPTQLTAAIRRVLRDPALSKKLGENLLQRSIAQSWDAAAAKHSELYRRLLATPH